MPQSAVSGIAAASAACTDDRVICSARDDIAIRSARDDIVSRAAMDDTASCSAMEESFTPEQAARRLTFPRGLAQPADAYRFGLDALLLAAWTADCLPVPATAASLPVAELGAGCGAAALGLTLLRPAIQVLALEREQALADAALANAAGLGLAERIAVLRGDIAETPCLHTAGYGKFAAVMANPPWWNAHAGRQSPSALRRAALSGQVQSGPLAAASALCKGTLPDGKRTECTQHNAAQRDAALTPALLPDGTRPHGTRGKTAMADAALLFAQAARALLTHHGRYCCIFAAAGLPRLLAALADVKLGLRRLRFVHALADRPAYAVLLEARKDARDDVRVEPPLFLHADAAAAREKKHTTSARDFCPWLG